MSMMCYLADLSPGQIAAFRERPSLGSDFAKTSVMDMLDARTQAGLARLPPDARQQYEQATRDLMAKNPSLHQQRAQQDATRLQLAKLGPFEPPLELAKAWHILHYLMTGHADGAAAPGNALLSGAPLGQDLGYGPPRLHDPGETRAFRDFLAPLEADHLVARIDFPQLVRQRVYPYPKFQTPLKPNLGGTKLRGHSRVSNPTRGAPLTGATGFLFG
jgi:hypothetical protein